MAMHVDAYIVTRERLLSPVDARGMSDDWFLDETVRWIKITSATPDEVVAALRPLELQPQVVQACANPRPPQVESFEKVLFVSMPLWRPEPARPSSIRFVCVATTLITIQDEPLEFMEDAARRFTADQRLRDTTTAALMLDLTEVVLRSLARPYLSLRDDVDATSDALETRPGEVDAQDLLALKRRAIRVSGLFDDYLYCLMEVEEARSDTLQVSAVRPWFRDLVMGLERAQRLIARTEERIRDLRQASLNYLQEATNRRLNILAVLSAIYLPSTLIAGIYGMNFEGIPITTVKHGYYVVLALMIGLVVGQIWFFHRRGWLR